MSLHALKILRLHSVFVISVFCCSLTDSKCLHCDSSLCLVRLIVIAMFHAHVESLSLRPLHLIHFLLFIIFGFQHFLLLFTFVEVSNKQPCALPLRSRGPQDYKNSSTGYEPNDYFLTETYVEFNHYSVTEQRFPEDLDYDDTVIGQTLYNAYRRRVDHAEGEGLSSGLSSSSMSHDRTVKHVIDRDKSHESSYEIQRQNSENEQIRILPDRQREQILAECQAEIRKHEFQAEYDRSRKQKLNEKIESQQEELHRAQAEDRRRQDQPVHEQSLKQNWDLREAHEKSLNEMEELEKFQVSTFDTITRRRLVEDQDAIPGTYW